jgi:uncharacterized cupredoxin-like copper-binding protein
MARSRIGLLALGVLVAGLTWALPAVAQQRAVHATTVTVTAGKPAEFNFKLSKTKAPKGVVTFKVTNGGTIAHDFKIAGKKTKLLQAGQSATLKITFTKTGKFPYLCTVPSHAAAGMKGNFTVT